MIVQGLIWNIAEYFLDYKLIFLNQLSSCIISHCNLYDDDDDDDDNVDDDDDNVDDDDDNDDDDDDNSTIPILILIVNFNTSTCLTLYSLGRQNSWLYENFPLYSKEKYSVRQ